MWGPVLGMMTGATTRIALWAVAVALWLFTRPGGWAVVVVMTLVGLQLFPAK